MWSGCISGAFLEDQFLEAFADAGFYGIEIVSRQKEAWATVEGIEFRSLTVQAFKGKDGPCLDRRQAVIYNGPWQSVTDDDGHTFIRGQRSAVCEKNFNIYTQAPYAEQITAIPPVNEVPIEEAKQFDCHDAAIRSPKETKQGTSGLTLLPSDDCCGSTGCC